MTTESLFDSLIGSRKIAYDNLLSSINKEMAVNNDQKDDACSSWAKLYQRDFSKFKSTSKDFDLPLIFGDVASLELDNALANSLARTGLRNKYRMNSSESALDSYSILETYLQNLQIGKCRECIEWCIRRASDLKPADSNMLLVQLLNLELMSAFQGKHNSLELAMKLREVRCFVNDALNMLNNLDLSSLNICNIIQKPKSCDFENCKQRLIVLFSSTFMSCMNLPRHDILKVR